MVKLTRCPNCGASYNLEGISLEASKGWVQCGDCDTKFKAADHSVDADTLKPKKTEPAKEKPAAQKKSAEEVVDKVLFDAESIDSLSEAPVTQQTVTESEAAMEMDDHRQFKNAFSQTVSEFSEEQTLIETPRKKGKTILEEELENNTVNSETLDGEMPFILRALGTLLLLLVFLSLLAVLAFQLQNRGIVSILNDKQYATLLEKVPYLQRFEKNKTDLSSLQIAYTDLKKGDDGLELRLKLVNQFVLAQPYPYLELEFTSETSQVIARKLISPPMYLDKGSSVNIGAKKTENVYLNLLALPKGAVGYQVKVVRKPAN